MATTGTVEVAYVSELEKWGAEHAPRGLVSAKQWWGATKADDQIPVRWSDGSHSSALRGKLVKVPAPPFQVNGVGPDAPIETTENGAKQSATPFAATSLPPKALLAIAAVQKGGDDKYGADNWRELPIVDHLNHAQVHYLAHMAGDTSEKHLEHYATRALMALELWLEQKGVV